MVLYVSPSGTNWKVHFQHETSGETFPLKVDAIAHARSIVRKNEKGKITQIKVQRADGTFQIEWTYGVDPYPPVG